MTELRRPYSCGLTWKNSPAHGMRYAERLVASDCAMHARLSATTAIVVPHPTPDASRRVSTGDPSSTNV